jgi:hypothetical protein
MTSPALTEAELAPLTDAELADLIWIESQGTQGNAYAFYGGEPAEVGIEKRLFAQFYSLCPDGRNYDALFYTRVRKLFPRLIAEIRRLKGTP